MRISPAIKGLLTAIGMIIFTLAIDKTKNAVSPNMLFLTYGLYAAGIVWTLIAFVNSSLSRTGKFAELFSHGFRCFIVVTLLMVVFTAIFIRMHPELAEQEAVATKEYYKKQGDKTLAEIEEMSGKAKKQYPVAVVSIAIFRYLILGAGFTAVTAVILKRRN